MFSINGAACSQSARPALTPRASDPPWATVRPFGGVDRSYIPGRSKGARLRIWRLLRNGGASNTPRWKWLATDGIQSSTRGISLRRRAKFGASKPKTGKCLLPHPADLDHYGWQGPCRSLLELPIAAWRRIRHRQGQGFPLPRRLSLSSHQMARASFGSATDSTNDDAGHRISPVVLGGCKVADAVNAVADVDEAFPARIRR